MLLPAALLLCCALRPASVAAQPLTAPAGKALPFPFRANTPGDAEYDLVIDLKDPAVQEKYKSVFRNNHLPFTATAFEEVILQLAEADAGLARTVITAAGDGRVLIGTGNPIYQQNFINLLRPVLQRPEALDRFLKESAQDGDDGGHEDTEDTREEQQEE